MKKVLAILLVIIFTATVLSACSGSTNFMSKSSSAPEYPAYASPSAAPMAPPPGGGTGYAPAPGMDMPQGDQKYSNSYGRGDSGESGVIPIVNSTGDSSLAEKIIYTVYADIQTIDFDASIDGVYKMMATYGAFIESSSIGGREYYQAYYGKPTYRNASFVIRVPVDRLNTVVETLGDLGYVTSTSSNGQNITAQFYDMQSRLNAYKVQEERLLDLLAKADTVSDMIIIEQRLAEVRYSIESFESMLTNWQNQVDYSTLTLNIREVEKFQETTPIIRSYWQQLGDGIKTSTKRVGEFFKDLFKWIVVNLPIIIVVVVIAVIVLLLIRRSARRKKAQEKNDQAFAYPQQPVNYQQQAYYQQQPVEYQQPPADNTQQPPEDQ